MIETLKQLNEELKAKKLEDLTNEASRCASAAAIADLLKSNGIEVSSDCAEQVYELFNKSVELSDDDLANVAGGTVDISASNPTCPDCGVPLIYVDHGFDCDGSCSDDMWRKYECPECHDDFYWYYNCGYWTD